MGSELTTPGNPDDDIKLAEEIAASVEYVAECNRRPGGGESILEAKDPARAAATLAAICRGVPERTIKKEIGTHFKTIRGLKRRHSDIIRSTRVHRSMKATALQLKAADALERKLDRVLDNEESLDKINAKDLALTYGIVTDKQRVIHGEAGVTVTHEHKVTLEDAQKAIEDAKSKVSQPGIIDV